MLSNAAFNRANARFLRRQAEAAAAAEARQRPRRALGLSRADLYAVVLRGIR